MADELVQRVVEKSYISLELMLYPNPQIYHHLKAVFVHIPKTGGTSIERSLADGSIVGGHTTALGFRRGYPSLFDEYFKFTVVRHPFDRFVSAYHYLANNPVSKALNNEVVHSSGSLSEFVKLVGDKPDTVSKVVHLMPQHFFVCDAGGGVLVDKVYRFDQLSDSWKDICDRLGLEFKVLPHLNASKHSDCLPLGAHEVIYNIYLKDFELFGYEP